MTNVIAIDEGRIIRAARKRETPHDAIMTKFRDSVVILRSQGIIREHVKVIADRGGADEAAKFLRKLLEGVGR